MIDSVKLEHLEPELELGWSWAGAVCAALSAGTPPPPSPLVHVQGWILHDALPSLFSINAESS
ncbi:hypothetical protein B0I35DRAFT_417267 [Stachybotrys elegans]|uniref:Uncharacterized protein n=1 Tax=Stachybotrys elegans TaxID=80388 RepID=A0A8K0WW70_9HYPO|nr:hypothetical protein B0I35DRAFT_417267 [Stachybotrys elegans]